MSSAEPPLDASTLFVRNLSPSATHAALEAHFSGVAPLRHAFVCTSSGSTRCKGFGFVHFTSADDAERARRLLDGSVLGGRAINVDVARRRMRRGGRDGEGEAGGKGEGEKIGEGEGGLAVKDKVFQGKDKKKAGALQGGLAMRTVIVRKARGDGGKSVGEAAVERRAVGEEMAAAGFVEAVSVGGGVVRAVFDSWPRAGKGAERLHGGGWDAVIEGVRGKGVRVIVRNLPFEVCEKEMVERFEMCGGVREVHVVAASEGRGLEKWGKEGEGGKVRSAGYGFVEYFLPSAANYAVQKMNGAKIGGRVVAVDLAVGKGEYKDATGKGGVESGGSRNEDGVKEEEVVAAAEKEGSDAEEKVEEEAVGAPLPVRREGKSTSEEMKRTVFVRNILFETSSAELRTAMETFGDVEQAVLVMDPSSGRPRGTAFVRFRDEIGAGKAVSASSGGAVAGKGHNAAILAATSGGGGGVVVAGRSLLVSKAVDRSRAKELVVAGDEKAGKKSDPRNLRLAWVGAVKGDAPEAVGISKEDMQKRTKAEKDKRAKLSHNPNAFVSEVRLSVRNLPREVDEKALKQICIWAVGKDQSSKGGGKSRGKDAFSGAKVVHSKILRDENRNGRSKGYGFVQFEKHDDAMDALQKLNNNPKLLDNLIRTAPKALEMDEEHERRMRKDWGNDRRLIVEFAVEDRRQVRIIEQVKSRGREKSAAIAAQRSKDGKSSAATGSAVHKKTPEKKSFSAARDRARRESGVSGGGIGKAGKKSAHKAAKLEASTKKTVVSVQETARPVPGAHDSRSKQGKQGKSSKRPNREERETEVAGSGSAPKKSRKAQAPKLFAAKSKKKQVEGDKEEKFQNLVDSYKRKVVNSNNTTGPRWFS